MGCELRLCGVEPESIVDGKGFRYVIFTQGCPHRCPGCHNPQSHDFHGGTLADTVDLFRDICENPLLRGVTFSGGEPFCQPRPLWHLAKQLHARGLDITVYTGYTYEALLKMKDPDIAALLAEADVLVDGPFVQAEKDLTLLYRGSRNQRVIDMNRTRAENRVVLFDLEQKNE